MPTTHRMRLLNVGAVLTAVLSISGMIGVAACGPPPPPPTELPGNPHFTGRQAATEIIGIGGNVFTCSIIVDTEWDLTYLTAVVNAKTSTTGYCLSEDYHDVRATASCSIGTTNALNCGAGWPVPVGPTYQTRTFNFGPVSPPHHGHLSVDLSATLILPSGLTFALFDHGDTPPILCSSELRQCKFQT
jgi:hypothetical protein